MADDIRSLFSQLDEKGQNELLDSLSDDELKRLHASLNGPAPQANPAAAKLSPYMQALTGNTPNYPGHELGGKEGAQAVNDVLRDPYNSTLTGLAKTVGLFGDTANNLDNLTRAGIGSITNLAGRPDLSPDPVPRDQALLSGDWLTRQMRQAGVLQEMRPGLAKNVYEGMGAGAPFGPLGAVSGGMGGLLRTGAENMAPDNPALHTLADVVGNVAPALLRSGAGYVPRKIVSKLDTPTALEGQKLESQTGTKLSLGQKTGDETLSSIEQGLKESSSDAKQFFNQQVKDAEAHLNTVAQTFSKKPAENLTMVAGEELKQGYDQAVSRYERLMKAGGRVEYGKFKHAVGDDPAIPMTNFLEKMQSLASDAIPGSEAAKAASQNALKSLKAQLDRGGGKLTADQFIDWQQKIGREMFQNLEKSGKGRIQGQLYDALFSDGEAFNGAAADQLKKAIGWWRRGNVLLEKVENSTAASIFGLEKFDPYQAAAKIDTLTPSKIMAAREATSRNPAAWEDATAAWIYRNLEKASNNPAALAGQSPFNPTQFLRQLPSRDHLNAIIPDPAKRETLTTGLKLLERVADKYGAGGQGMGVRQTFADIAGNAAGGNPIFIARLAGKYMGPIGLGKLLMTEKGQQLLRRLATPERDWSTPAKLNMLDDLIQYMDDEKQKQ